MSEKMYGAKCHKCACLLGATHDVDPVPWLVSHWAVVCDRCSFCQERALLDLIAQGGLGLFDPEVRKAVHAFQRGEPHRLIDELRAEIQNEPEVVTFRGRDWLVADSRWDESELGVGSHYHLTLTPVAASAEKGRPE